MVELRKRKDPPVQEVAANAKPPATKKHTDSVVAAKANAKQQGQANGQKADSPNVGDVIDISGFGGEVELNDGTKTSFEKLLGQSKTGVVLFTYPKASTPGCTTQVCLFRDSYESLTGAGLSIYGLSRDSTKSNTTFQTKQKLPYPLICDPSASLIRAIGFKNGDKTQRGVFVMNKDRKVLVVQPGGPAATLQAVQAILASLPSNGHDRATGADGNANAEGRDSKSDREKAEVAAQVADTAEKLDA